MNLNEVIQQTTNALWLCLVLSLPAVLVSAVTGLVVAVLQTITSIQDSSLGHAIKLLTVSVALAVSAAWLGAQLLQFAQSLFTLAFL